MSTSRIGHRGVRESVVVSDNNNISDLSLTFIVCICIWCVQKQDVVILAYHLVHWEDSESLASHSMSVVSACKEGPLLCKANNYSYMFGVSPTWTPAYFVLKYVFSLFFTIGTYLVVKVAYYLDG